MEGEVKALYAIRIVFGIFDGLNLQYRSLIVPTVFCLHIL